MLPARPRAHALLGLLLLGAGWRFDGSGEVPNSSPPADLNAITTCWRQPLPSWGNATPVPFGDLLMVQAEPTGLMALDAVTGEVRWQASNEVVDVVGPTDAARIRALVAQLPGWERDLVVARTQLAAARLDARRQPPVADAQARLAASAQQIADLSRQIDALAPYVAGGQVLDVGYASPTPAAAGDTLVTLYGNGVVSAWRADGTRRWGRWLGPGFRPMNGFDQGTASSPLIVDGLALVAHGELLGLDLATGSTVWSAGPWPHYGTPLVLEVGGVALLATPDGRVLRASTGEVLAQGLGDLWYVGPVGQGDLLSFVGNVGGAFPSAPREATTWRLGWEEGRLTTVRLWSRTLPESVDGDLFTGPIFVDDTIVGTSARGDVFALDALTGTLRGEASLRAESLGLYYANPVLVADRLLLVSEAGEVWSAPRATPTALKRTAALNIQLRATVLPIAHRLYVRERDALTCYEGAPRSSP